MSAERKDDINLDEFLAAYHAANDEHRRNALSLAMNALSGEATIRKYLTTNQLAEKLGLHRSTIWRWGFPAHNRAGDKRFDLAECEAYLDSPELENLRKQLNDESRSRGKMLSKLKSQFGRVV